jgi:hypothetical protein
MRLLSALALACFLTVVSLVAPAGAQYGGGPSITLYASPNFGGGQRTYNGPVGSLLNVGFNDVAASATVRSGTWQLCDHIGFAGRCITLRPGSYRLANMGMDYRISSLQPVGGGGGYGYGGPPAGAMNMGTTNISGPVGSIFLYSQPGLSGPAKQLHQPVANLSNVGFGGQTWSASVVSGRWQLCTGVGYAPPCYTLNPGRYNQLFGSRGNIWSARPI